MEQITISSPLYLGKVSKEPVYFFLSAKSGELRFIKYSRYPYWCRPSDLPNILDPGSCPEEIYAEVDSFGKGMLTYQIVPKSKGRAEKIIRIEIPPIHEVHPHQLLSMDTRNDPSDNILEHATEYRKVSYKSGVNSGSLEDGNSTKRQVSSMGVLKIAPSERGRPRLYSRTEIDERVSGVSAELQPSIPGDGESGPLRHTGLLYTSGDDLVCADKPKRKRRTKLEMIAARNAASSISDLDDDRLVLGT